MQSAYSTQYPLRFISAQFYTYIDFLTSKQKAISWN